MTETKARASRTLAATCIVALVVATTWACGSSGSAASGDGGADGAACPAPDPVPASSPSPGKARFVITNHTTTTRWVAHDSGACDAFAIDGVALHAAFVCGCECASVADDVLTFVPLEPGASTTLEWNETRVVTYTSGWTPNLCPTDECMPTPAAVAQAVASGTYTATFLVADAAMFQALGGALTDAGTDAGTPATVPEHIDRLKQQGLCPMVPTVQKTFTVPATFDVEVDISLDP
ncbi:MAG TPA: hypothetical protein VIF62_35655 [Labilithrix sp.]